MEIAVLHRRDSLNDIFSRNNLAPPQRPTKPIANCRRRSLSRHQDASSPILASLPLPLVPKGTEKTNLSQTSNIVSGQVRILKRGEDIGKKTPDPAIKKPDLKSTRQIGSDPKKISTQIRIPERKQKPALFYAGPVTSTSPPASEVPLPAFFSKKSVSVIKSADATNNLILDDSVLLK